MSRLAHRLSLQRSLQCAAYSTEAPKVSIKLVAELRKQNHVSISKAREALTHSNGSIPGALEWLQHDLVSTGIAKAAKVSARATFQGVVAHSVLSSGAGLNAAGGVRAAMVELNCETDFVSQNELFRRLALDVANTAAFISEARHKLGARPEFASLAIEELSDAPLIPHSDPSSPSGTVGPQPGTTVATAIRDTIVKVGENISLRRATAIVEDAPLSISSSPITSTHRLGTYMHGVRHALPCGSIGAVALLSLRSPNLSTLLRTEAFRRDLDILERALAQQLVGMETLSVLPQAGVDDGQTLYRQEFFTLPVEQLRNLRVGDALRKWSVKHGLIGSEEEEGGVDVLDFSRWAANFV